VARQGTRDLHRGATPPARRGRRSRRPHRRGRVIACPPQRPRQVVRAIFAGGLMRDKPFRPCHQLRQHRVLPHLRLHLLDPHDVLDPAVEEGPGVAGGRGFRRQASRAPSPHRRPTASRAWCTSCSRRRCRPAPSRSHPPCPRPPRAIGRVHRQREQRVPRRTASLSVIASIRRRIAARPGRGSAGRRGSPPSCAAASRRRRGGDNASARSTAPRGTVAARRRRDIGGRVRPRGTSPRTSRRRRHGAARRREGGLQVLGCVGHRRSRLSRVER
jgi:hypothetical protein